MHEYGHALVARRVGIEVPDITLLPLGGMARLERLPDKAWDEVKISIAGPPVNIALAAVFYGVAYLLQTREGNLQFAAFGFVRKGKILR